MDGQIDATVKIARLTELQALLERQRQAFNQACVGRRFEVLLEKRGRREGQVAGRTPYMQAMFAEGEPSWIGAHGRDRDPGRRAEFAQGTNCLAPVVKGGFDRRAGRFEPGTGTKGESRFEAAGFVAVAHRRRSPALNPTLRKSKPGEISIAFPDNAAASVVFGHYDQNIARIERSLGVSAYANGNQVVIKGPREASEHARRVFEMLYERVKLGQPASEGDVEGAIAESAYQGLLFPGEDGTKDSFGVIKTRKRGVVRARSAAQDRYLAALRKYELVFAEGPAGTGKTWLAVGHAVSLLEQGLVERLVLSRPAGRSWRTARLPARRHARQGRPLSAPHLRRAV